MGYKNILKTDKSVYNSFRRIVIDKVDLRVYSEHVATNIATSFEAILQLSMTNPKMVVRVEIKN